MAPNDSEFRGKRDTEVLEIFGELVPLANTKPVQKSGDKESRQTPHAAPNQEDDEHECTQNVDVVITHPGLEGPFMAMQREEEGTEQNGNPELHEGPAPLAQSFRDIRIPTALLKAADTEKRKAEQNKREIASMKGERWQVRYEPEKSLQRIREDGDSEEEYEVNDRVEGPRDEMMPKNAVMLEPKAANESKSADDGKPACRVEDILDPGRNVEPSGEQREAETKDQVAECLKP